MIAEQINYHELGRLVAGIAAWGSCCLLLAAGTAFAAGGPQAQPESRPGGTVFEDVHVVKMPVREYGYRGLMGTLAELKDRSLLFAYTLNDGIGGRLSTDRGKTWGDEFTIIPKPKPNGPDYNCHPSLLRLANGQLMLCYIYVGKPEPPYYGATYFRRSTDEGKSWFDQYTMTPAPGYNIMHNDKLVQLSSGRLIAPVEFELKSDPGGHSGYISTVFCSDDNGYSWRRAKNEVNMLPVEAQEPHVVELRDKRLLMLTRTYSGFVGRCYSSDSGETWSPGEPVPDLKLSTNASALNVKRIPSTGDLLLVRCTGTGKDGKYRTPFVSAISKDDGRTWTNERVIAGDPDDDYGYPCLTFVDNLALVGYHRRDGLHMARIGIDWLYGK